MRTDAAIVYATHDGHTRKLALYLAEKLLQYGLVVTVDDLAQNEPDGDDLAATDRVVVMAPIRYGYHLPRVDAFLRRNLTALNEKDLTIVSINLTARKEGKDRPETNPYLKKWLRKQKICPARCAVFAGKLNYALYRWWEQQIIRLIMKITGGPTNLDANIDFTRWDRVDELARQIAAASGEKKTEKEKAA